MAATKRNSNIELLRIFAMLMIIAYHIYCHCVNIQLTNTNSMTRLGNGLFNTPNFYKKLLILVTVSPIGQIANAIFIIISGFFMVSKGKNINLTKISQKLLLQQGFAAALLTVGSTLFFLLTDGIFVNLINVNIFNNMSWYVGYYFSIIVFAKLFLNKFLAGIDRKQYLEFLLVIFAIIQFNWSGGVINSLASGLLTFCTGVFLYSLGGYIQKYNPFSNIKTVLIIGFVIVIYLLIYVSSFNIIENKIQIYYGNKSTDVFIQTLPGVENNYFIPITIGVSLFELFRRIPEINSRIINYVGASTFMVYLLHDNSFFYGIWNTQDWITVLYYHPCQYILKHFVWTMMTFGIGILAYSLYLLVERAISKYVITLLFSR